MPNRQVTIPSFVSVLLAATLPVIVLISGCAASQRSEGTRNTSPASAEQSSLVHTIFMHVRTTPEWLRLSPTERFQYLGTNINPILEAHPSVTVRFFDSEFYSAQVSDVIVFETNDLRQYQSVIERLREGLFWGTYFEVVSVIPSVENAYAEYYDQEPIAQPTSR